MEINLNFGLHLSQKLRNVVMVNLKKKHYTAKTNFNKQRMAFDGRIGGIANFQEDNFHFSNRMEGSGGNWLVTRNCIDYGKELGQRTLERGESRSNHKQLDNKQTTTATTKMADWKIILLELLVGFQNQAKFKPKANKTEITF